jgi:DNA-nicking Smr family endonuclease
MIDEPRKRRIASDDERKLFEQTFKEGRPIKPATPKKVAAKKTTGRGSSGINGATQERLRRGLMEPDARIDLHGMTQQAAHRTLHTWLVSAHRSGHRLVLVITGKGNPKNDENAPWMMAPHGVLKQMVPRWLNEAELAPLIASVRTAHAKHGGGGALYVYLRKKA